MHLWLERTKCDWWSYISVINRANARMQIFDSKDDFNVFEKIITEVCERIDMRILSYCIMPNHWHFVLCPTCDGNLLAFMGWLTMMHTQRWHAYHHSAGSGHVYQGRFKSIVVQEDEHLLTVCRYVERNAVRANLVEKAEDWRWNSLYRFKYGSEKEKSLLSEWPLNRPMNWLNWVNEPQTEKELDALRNSVVRDAPFGTTKWVEMTAQIFG